ncbi:LOW QUALITY PROTEIN: hypothetical protein PanWU01x14_226830, partial [Parasponia andersonii]
GNGLLCCRNIIGRSKKNELLVLFGLGFRVYQGRGSGHGCVKSCGAHPPFYPIVICTALIIEVPHISVWNLEG